MVEEETMSLELVVSWKLIEVERIELASTSAAENRRAFDILKKYGKLDNLKVMHLNGRIFMVASMWVRVK